MTKVDSLSVVSNTRQLPLASNPETKANIELFPNDKLKTNVDEVNISSRNSDVNTEEKNDKKRKWLIAAGIAVGAVAVGVAGYFLLRKAQTPKYEISSELSSRLKAKPDGEKLFDEQFKEFSRLRRKKIKHDINPVINEGDLIHGAYYNPEVTRSTLKNGIMSGEIGLKDKNIIFEDGETFGCADFFSSPKKMSIEEYFKDFVRRDFKRPYGQSPEKSFLPFNVREHGGRGQRKIAYVIDMEKLKKDGAKLLKNSCTPSTLSRSSIDGIVSHFPMDYENLQATLVGIPVNYVSKIIVGDRVSASEVEAIKQMAKESGLDLKIYNIIGELL